MHVVNRDIGKNVTFVKPELPTLKQYNSITKIPFHPFFSHSIVHVFEQI